MGKAMRDIAQGEGDLTRRLDVHSQDEFGELARNFNLFVKRIHHSSAVGSKLLAASNACIVIESVKILKHRYWREGAGLADLEFIAFNCS
jgi:hypothetical protein